MAAQLVAALARARQVRELFDLIGAAALSQTRAYLEFEEAFRSDLVDQRPDESRSFDDTLDRAWRALLHLPARELTMLPGELVDLHRTG
ncbi:hypothetical protein [Saccharopolyspora hirsuta]|uniref:ATP synthase beta subunit C-terminal domain-containing protein n=1 Tax=Saccharopolyspora hirsuta TaxID=1837 RepID=UPI001FE66A15|nr:hypothetical protein [Saccharopolyspora hirsuta]